MEREYQVLVRLPAVTEYLELRFERLEASSR
jgi:hypothetical protein